MFVIITIVFEFGTNCFLLFEFIFQVKDDYNNEKNIPNKFIDYMYSWNKTTGSSVNLEICTIEVYIYTK